MKKKIIGIAVLVLAVMVGVIGYFAYQENVKQKNIKTQIGKIESVQKEFKKSSDRKMIRIIIKRFQMNIQK